MVKTIKLRWFKDRNGKEFTMPQAVEDAIRHRFPEEADKILDEVHFNTLSSYFSFVHIGMYFGVELDGYLHT